MSKKYFTVKQLKEKSSLKRIVFLADYYSLKWQAGSNELCRL